MLDEWSYWLRNVPEMQQGLIEGSPFLLRRIPSTQFCNSFEHFSQGVGEAMDEGDDELVRDGWERVGWTETKYVLRIEPEEPRIPEDEMHQYRLPWPKHETCRATAVLGVDRGGELMLDEFGKEMRQTAWCMSVAEHQGLHDDGFRRWE